MLGFLPRPLTTVQFHEDQVLVAKGPDGTLWVPVRCCCELMPFFDHTLEALRATYCDVHRAKEHELEGRKVSTEAREKTVQFEKVGDKFDRRKDKLGVGDFLRLFEIYLSKNGLGGYGIALTKFAEATGRKGEIEAVENASVGVVNVYPPDLLCAYFHGKKVGGKLLDTSQFEERRRKARDERYGDSLRNGKPS